MRKVLFFLLAFFSVFNLSAQVKVQRLAIIGTWDCTKVSYGDYYTFNLTTNELKAGEELEKLVKDDPERLGGTFLNTLKTKLASQLKSYSLNFTDGNAYRISFKESSYGSYAILKPFVIDKSSETPESDITSFMRYGSGKITRISLTNRSSANPQQLDYNVNEKSIDISEYVSGDKGNDVPVTYTFTKTK